MCPQGHSLRSWMSRSSDLIEAQPEPLRAFDELEVVGKALVVLAIPRRTALRLWHQTEALVIAHGCRGKPTRLARSETVKT